MNRQTYYMIREGVEIKEFVDKSVVDVSGEWSVKSVINLI